jgi:peroxiredoxin (alkyl hydroperoxide reductase subunit C)
MPQADTPPPQRPPRIGEPAPDFSARSTRGLVRLSSLRGRWVLLFCHPADFTPVCTTEFVALARLQPEFEALGCTLLGLSVDSLYAHIAWARAIEQRFGVAIDFPLIEDPNMAIGRAYGMIDDTSIDARAMRSVFFIDPAGTIRATLTYPHDVGRSADELLRLLQALQAVETGEALAPEGWQPGAPLLEPAPEDGAASGDDWFCRMQP